MPRARKTVNVDQILFKANRALATMAEGNDPQFRNGVIAMLESILMDTGNYHGFRWTDGANGRHDHTRRFYYGPNVPDAPRATA